MANTLDSKTREKGILNSSPDGTTQFLGSASGISFLRDMKSAFLDTNGALDKETILGVIIPNLPDPSVLPGRAASVTSIRSPRNISQCLSAELAQKLALPFFRYFHPLVPFLDGPSTRSDLEQLSTKEGIALDGNRATIIRAVLSIGVADDPRLASEPAVQQMIFKSASDALSHVELAATRYDLETIQALLSILVYLYARMFLQSSYEVSCLIRAKVHLAGLHRCPARYSQFSGKMCDLRKRVYWSAYSLDRILSQSLGLPIGYQDSDCDVCSLIHEQHVQGFDVPVIDKFAERAVAAECSPIIVSVAFSEYCHLVGETIEIFNKSIHVRHVDNEKVQEIKSRVEFWKNTLHDGLMNRRNDEAITFENSCFFSTLYHHLTILIHRPRLSLSMDSSEFKYALQICINSSREVLALMTDQCNSRPDQSLFWPGYLPMVWMSAWIVAYAAKIGSYPVHKSRRDLMLCIPLCETLSNRWKVAAKCREMLAVILKSLDSLNGAQNDLQPNRKKPRRSDSVVADKFGDWEELNEIFDVFMSEGSMWKGEEQQQQE
ncbi:hypothetical protein V1511DRAFT_43710 [Dipodascopsis uninucleata]